MKRTFIFSSPTFQGFRVPVDVLAAGSVDAIVAECVRVLCATFRALGTERLVELAESRGFHIHSLDPAAGGATNAQIYAEILTSEPHTTFFVCETHAAPAPDPSAVDLSRSAIAEITTRLPGPQKLETVHVCLLPLKDALACADSLHGTRGVHGEVVDNRYFFLTAAKPRTFDAACVAGLARLTPPLFVQEFLRMRKPGQ